ncbi:MAG: hypothetical protein ACRDSF_00175 [Pseudonocardiaceae bacterium]
MPTYLDDPDHRWEIEPGASGDAYNVLDEFLSRVTERPEDADIIIKGAMGLIRRNAGDAVKCLDTSMTWFYG